MTPLGSSASRCTIGEFAGGSENASPLLTPRDRSVLLHTMFSKKSSSQEKDTSQDHTIRFAMFHRLLTYPFLPFWTEPYDDDLTYFGESEQKVS